MAILHEGVPLYILLMYEYTYILYMYCIQYTPYILCYVNKGAIIIIDRQIIYQGIINIFMNMLQREKE